MRTIARIAISSEWPNGGPMFLDPCFPKVSVPSATETPGARMQRVSFSGGLFYPLQCAG
jgi:hypothetical protein